MIQATSGKNLNSASWSRFYIGTSLWYIGRHLKSFKGIHVHSVNLFTSFSAKMDMLIMSDRVYFSNINSLNVILFSRLTCFGKLAFFNFRHLFLTSDPFRSIRCIGCKLIVLADEIDSNLVIILKATVTQTMVCLLREMMLNLWP